MKLNARVNIYVQKYTFIVSVKPSNTQLKIKETNVKIRR